MIFYASLEDVPVGFGPSAVTIGKFDGVHAGHRSVIERLRSAAAVQDLVSTVLTFDRHPLALLKPELCPQSLMSNDQKRGVLESTGIDAMVMIQFTRAFSLQEPEDFVRHVLVEALNARLVFVGEDFRFGREGRGTVELLTRLGSEFGFEVRTIAAVKPEGERVISSSWIRDLLSEGRIAEAVTLLGRRPSVRAVVVQGEHRGRQLGYPTANLSQDVEGYVPADGVYAAYATVDGRTMPAAVSIGNNPTFAGVRDKQVEAHLLDVDLDLYGKTVEVSFVEYIRGMEKFPGVEELVAQIALDEARVRELLGVAARTSPIGPRAEHPARHRARFVRP
jgi:riboflavin kinase/FMN adenylyltransferase